MKTIFRMTGQFLKEMKRDLARQHRFAAERVGFISIRATGASNNLVLLAEDYHPVADNDYVDNPTVGAMMSQEAIRKALNIALLQSVGMFHVHMHEHTGRPKFSRIDLREQMKFVPDFFKVCRRLPHGAIVLSHDLVAGRVWIDSTTVVDISEFNTFDSRTKIDIVDSNGSVDIFA